MVMTAENPYATPAGDPTHPDALPQRNQFAELTTKELRTLRNDSHSIRTMAVLLVLGVVVLGLLGFTSFFARMGGLEVIALSGFVTLNLVTAFGLLRRNSWGRPLGFVVGGLMLLAFPVGTLIGVMCLFALGRGGRLFGPERLEHRALEQEWRHRKKHRIP